MFSFLRNMAAVAAIGTLCAACSTVPAYKPLDPAVKPRVTATTGVVTIPQREIYATIYTAPPGSGGLIGAIIQSEIDKHRTKEAETGMVPLRNSLLDFNFDPVLQSDLQQQLSAVDWLHLQSVSVIKDNSVPAVDQAITSAPTPYVLLVAADYHVTPDFDALLVTLRATLLPSKVVPIVKHGKVMNASASDSQNALYTEQFAYRVDIPQDTLDKLTDQVDAQEDADEKQGKKDDSEIDDDRQAALNYWMQNNDKIIKDSLVAGAAELSRLLARNMMQGLPVIAATDPKIKVDNKQGQTQAGTVIGHEDNGRILVEFDDESIESIEQWSTESVKKRVAVHSTHAKTASAGK